MRQWRILNSRIIDPANGIDRIGDCCVADGRIVSVGSTPDGFSSERDVPGEGRILCPGFVDLSAGLREPGLEHKGSIASETTAAAAGGFTTICCPPDTDPVIDTPAVAALIQRRAQAVGKCRVVVMGALTQALAGEHLSEMAALGAVGCVGVTNLRRPMHSTLVLRRALEYAQTHNLTVFSHPDDAALSSRGIMHEGAVATRLGLRGIPEAAETVAVGRDLALVAQTGARLHFCRLTTARAVQKIAQAQADGLPVSADIGIHYAHSSDMDLQGFNAQFHVLPPFRRNEDRLALIQGLVQGTLSAICSDHQPHESDAKEGPIGGTEPGISALETYLPLLLQLANSGNISLSQAIAAATIGPAKILGIQAGDLSSGAPADLCLIDPEREWIASGATLLSRGLNTPYLGKSLRGRVTLTALDGQIVHTLETQ